jgi:hypothetical protein
MKIVTGGMDMTPTYFFTRTTIQVKVFIITQSTPVIIHWLISQCLGSESITKCFTTPRLILYKTAIRRI